MRLARLPIAAALISAFNLASFEVAANTLPVANCNDSGTGSLRSAITSAANNDVIDMTQLACSTITLAAASGPLQTGASAANVTLNGPASHTLTIDGGRHDRVIRHLGSGTIALNDLTIMNGKYDPASGGSPEGGCIDAAAGSISLTRSHVSSCVTQTPGHGGCINARNSVTLMNSTLSVCEGAAEALKGDEVQLQDSSITNSAGGISAYSAQLRRSTVSGVANVGVYAIAGIELYDSTISDNGLEGVGVFGTDVCDEYDNCYFYPSEVLIHSSIITGNGKGGVISSNGHVGVYASNIERNQGNGGIFNAGLVDLMDSTVSGNEAAPRDFHKSSGGIFAGKLNAARSTISGNVGDDAGGVLARDLVTLVNTTVSSNRAASGTQAVGGIKVTFIVQLYNSTIAFNSGDAVGGIYADSGKIISSIIAGNVHSSASYDRNLFVKTSAMFSNNVIISANVTTGAITVDPKLTPLANHGGLVPAHALLATSPAIGAGSNPMNVATDARGTGFARVVGANPDIGAYERQADEDEIFGNGIDGP